MAVFYRMLHSPKAQVLHWPDPDVAKALQSIGPDMCILHEGPGVKASDKAKLLPVGGFKPTSAEAARSHRAFKEGINQLRILKPDSSRLVSVTDEARRVARLGSATSASVRTIGMASVRWTCTQMWYHTHVRWFLSAQHWSCAPCLYGVGDSFPAAN